MVNPYQQIIAFVRPHRVSELHDEDISWREILIYLEEIACNSSIKYDIRETAVDYLIRNEQNTPLIVYQNIYQKCHNDRMKDYILYNLGYYYNETSSSIIIEIITKENDPNLIVRGILGLSRRQDSKVFDFLVSISSNDARSEVFETSIGEAAKRVCRDIQESVK